MPDALAPRVVLLSRGAILGGYIPYVRRCFVQAMAQKGLQLMEGAEVVEVAEEEGKEGEDDALGRGSSSSSHSAGDASTSGGSHASRGGANGASGGRTSGSSKKGARGAGNGSDRAAIGNQEQRRRRRLLVRLSNGKCVRCDEVLWCTQAAAAAWIKETGLPTGEGGSVASCRGARGWGRRGEGRGAVQGEGAKRLQTKTPRTLTKIALHYVA